MKYLLISGPGLLLILFASCIIAEFCWKYKSRRFAERLNVVPGASGQINYVPEMLAGLPEPVQRYFRTVLAPGVPMLNGARLVHRGSFNMAENGSTWKPFSSVQRVRISPPGFLWNAGISVFPGVRALVHDAYSAGEGILNASLGGLIPLVKLKGPGELARGELMRYLAEAAWYPTALLPSENLHWEAVDNRSARVFLHDGDITVSLLFRFDDRGLIGSVYSEGRERMSGGKMEIRPWEGRWSDYRWKDGMHIPFSGEVLWHLTDGELPYWRGKLKKIEYMFADARRESTRG